MNDVRFWAMIESAWQVAGGRTDLREKLAAGEISEEESDTLTEFLAVVIPALADQLGRLSAEELLGFDRFLERKLYDIDRAEIQEHTDGSDDGFLYARGFIVVAGEAYYNAVNADPSVAISDMECEEVCYLPISTYEEKFGAMPGSGISRETCSNRAGWPDLE